MSSTLQSKLNQKDAIYKDQLNQQIAFYESLKQDYVKNNNLSSETGAINHDKCIERETDLTNENIVLKNELEQMKLKEIDYKRQISECELRYRNLFSKYDVLLKKEQEYVLRALVDSLERFPSMSMSFNTLFVRRIIRSKF